MGTIVMTLATLGVDAQVVTDADTHQNAMGTHVLAALMTVMNGVVVVITAAKSFRDKYYHDRADEFEKRVKELMEEQDSDQKRYESKIDDNRKRLDDMEKRLNEVTKANLDLERDHLELQREHMISKADVVLLSERLLKATHTVVQFSVEPAPVPESPSATSTSRPPS